MLHSPLLVAHAAKALARLARFDIFFGTPRPASPPNRPAAARFLLNSLFIFARYHKA
jgi:hypothetical protein